MARAGRGRQQDTDMRDPAIVEEDLIEISSIADDLQKFERIVAWCAAHPDEVPFALKILMNRGAEK
jgi:hypothetical protein